MIEAKLKLDVTTPFDGSLIETIPMNDLNEAETMLNTAYALYKNKDAWLQPYKRIAILNKLASLVESEADDFAMLIAKEGGKPLMDAKVEVARAIDGIYLAAKELLHIMRGEEIPMGHTKASLNRKASTTYEPIGVVLAISAFNHPLNLIVHQVVPAIAVGCPVVIKPASGTPLNCIKFVELAYKAGLPKEWCQTVICDNKVTEKLVTSNKIDFLSFIGSAKIGWWLRSILAPGTRCALEHGGVAPVIVDKSADLDKAVPALLKGGFYHSGQVCVSVQRIFAHSSIIDELVIRLSSGAEKLKIGDACKADTEAGPLIKNSEVDRVEQWVKEAVDGGAKLITGGNRLSDSIFEATVLLNPPANAKVSTTEVFGPVICIYEYENLDDAIKKANSLEFAFQAAVFTEDLKIAEYVSEKIDASAVMINDHTAFRVDWMPFAGRKASGYGIGGIGYTMHDMLKFKMVVFNNN